MNEGEFAPSGNAMTESESVERIREGLKIASDGASHLAYHQNDMRWGMVCHMLDVFRADGFDTAIVSESKMTLYGAFERHIEGLKQAAGGARQMAVYHRVDVKWLRLANQIEDMREKALELARRRATPRLVVPANFGLH